MGLDFCQGPSLFTKPTRGREELLPEEMTVDIVDVVISFHLRTPHPGVLVIIAAETDEGSQARDVRADYGAGDHAVLDLVNLPDMILYVIKAH